MKNFLRITSTILFLAVLAFAGNIYVYPLATSEEDASTAQVYKENLIAIDSLIFKNTTGFLKAIIRGNENQNLYSKNIDSIFAISFDIQDTSIETMSIEITNGFYAGTQTIPLHEIESISFFTLSDTDDSDNDGLSDYEEIYILKTDPKNADTDGDGWTDKEEMEMFNSENPTLWNPKIADVPHLSISLLQTPLITLNISSSEGSTETQTISEGRNINQAETIGSTQTAGSQVMNGFSVNSHAGFDVGTKNTGVNFSIGITSTNNYTSSNGASWTSSEQKAIAKTYNQTVAQAQSENKTISGSSIFMQVKLKNTSKVAFDINSLTLSAVSLNSKNEEKIIAELDYCATGKLGVMQPGDSLNALFCNRSVPKSITQNFINNPGLISLRPTTQKLLYTKVGSRAVQYDFTEAYTNVAAKTAHIIVDYGNDVPPKDFQIATKYDFNPVYTSAADMYRKTTLLSALSEGDINFLECDYSYLDKTFHGLYGIDNFFNDMEHRKNWSIAVRKATTPNYVTFYSPIATQSFHLDSITVSAGDEILIFYSEDYDNDGLSLTTEKILGTSDSILDSDADGLNDSAEVNGWKNAEGEVFFTNPAMADTDNDGIIDSEDDDPLNRPLSNSAKIADINFVRKTDNRSALVLWIADTALTDTVKVQDLFGKQAKIVIGTWENVESISLSYNGKTYIPTSSGKDHEFTIDLVPEEKDMKVTVTPEIGDSKTFDFKLQTRLVAPDSVTITKAQDNTALTLTYPRNIHDDQVMGYVIIRAESPLNPKDYNSSTDNARNQAFASYEALKNLDTLDFSKIATIESPITKPEEGMDLGNGLTIVGVKDTMDNRFVDEVEPGSPYYSYRVYAYTKIGDKYIFSRGTPIKTKSAGRILMKYALVSIGAHSYSDFWGIYDMRIEATLSAGTKQLTHYNYWFRGAGDSRDIKEMLWEEKADKIGNIFSSVEFNKKIQTTEIGKDGLSISFQNTTDRGDNKIITYSHVNWSYEKMADHLSKGTLYTDAEVPPNNKKIYIVWGQNETFTAKFMQKCNETCGDPPYSGYEFQFSYEFIE